MRFKNVVSDENLCGQTSLTKCYILSFEKKIRLSQKRAIIIYIDGREAFPDFNCLVRTYLKIRFIYLYLSTSFLFVYLLPGFPKVACVADAKHNPNIRRLLKSKLNA